MFATDSDHCAVEVALAELSQHLVVGAVGRDHPVGWSADLDQRQVLVDGEHLNALLHQRKRTRCRTAQAEHDDRHGRFCSSDPNETLLG